MLLAFLTMPRHSLAETRHVTRKGIKAIVQRHLAAQPGYQSGDLITRDDVEAIFQELHSLGIKPSDDHEELYERFVPADGWLAHTLRTPAGRTFMRQVKQVPLAYDRLERLSWMPQGQALLKQLIAAPDGPDQFRRLTSSEGMQLVTKSMRYDPRGRNFNLPTGHIHTEDQFLASLDAMAVKQGIR